MDKEMTGIEPKFYPRHSLIRKLVIINHYVNMGESLYIIIYDIDMDKIYLKKLFILN